MDSFTFSQVPTADIPRSTFNRSHGHKTTFDAGYLVPIYVDEALPGDTFKVSASMFARLSTPIVPVMDNLYLDVFFFFVPNRLLWTNWQKFMGEQANPGDSIDYLVPVITTSNFAAGSIFDYFGVPTGNLGSGVSGVNALHARAYNLIYNEWFRDENMVNSAPKNVGDGPDALADYTLRKRGKRHDYFTSALPWPQKGTGATIPITGTAPVVPFDTTYDLPQFTWDGSTFTALQAVAGSNAIIASTANPAGATRQLQWKQGYDAVQTNAANTGLMTDFTKATITATINSLRQAFQIQKLLERDARGGTRYIEILRSHFGVVSPDARLQRPEYLGGGSVPVMINPVSKTSTTDATSPQGYQAAYGVAGGKGIGFSKSFVEHGVVLGIICARADLTYAQGLPRMFSRRTRYDFYWPAFAHLGEQTILNKEIYYQGVPATDDAVFGYQERWAEYRYFPSKVTGKFRNNAAGTLNMWHLSQVFSSLPTLNQTFIEETPPMSRIKAVTTEPDFIFDSHFQIACTRPMPTYSIPGLIDHF